jgi:uncharacterized protein
MLRGLVEAARALDDASMRDLALRNAEFLARAFVRDNRVLRSYKDGVSKGAGFLEDHAAVALGWLDVYALTGERRWLDLARSLGDAARQWFWDEAQGVWYDTALDHEPLITRPRDVGDNALPSGTSLACELMLRLGVLTGDESYRAISDRVLGALGGILGQHPSAFGHLLGVAEASVLGILEVAIVGPATGQNVAEMLRHVATRYLPGVVLVRGDGDPAAAEGVPLLLGRDGGRHGVAYVCRHYACEAPAHSAAELGERLDAALRARSIGVP